MATVYSGGAYINATFTGDSRGAILQNVAAQLVNAGWTPRPYAAGQGNGNRGTFTVTIASPGVVTFTGHGFLGGERVVLTTTGALPTGLSQNTTYYVKYVDANTFNLSATAGGANINTSGSQSGTHTLGSEYWVVESATQSGVTNPVRAYLFDTKANCAGVTIGNSAGTLIGAMGTSSVNGGFLLPGASKTFRVLATRYHFLVLVPGSTAQRDFVMAGMPYVDSSILAGVTDIGYMMSAVHTDSITAAYKSFRTDVYASGCCAMLYNVNLWSSSGTNSLVTLFTGAPMGISSSSPTQRNYRWANDDLLTSDVLACWPVSASGDESKVRGQFFDLILIGDAFNMDTTTSFGGHDWYNITDNRTADAYNPRAGMWVATS